MQLLNTIADAAGLPKNANSFMFTFLQRQDSVVVLMGHPPRSVIDQALQAQGLPKLLVIEQPEMHDENPGTYNLRLAGGEVRRFDARTPLEQALRQVGAIKGDQASVPAEVSSFLLPTVVLAGLADGINPCAFAVMAFFTALLFALRRSRLHILQMGSLYIVGMYVTYFALGLGLLQVLTALGQPHFITQVGGALAIAFGLLQIKEGLFPGLPLHLTVPKPGWELIQAWARRTNQPGAAVLGGLVGLCTLPCSGGVYVAVLGLLSARASYTGGLGYLAIYNAAFVLPLVAILLAIGNRRASLALAGWERTNTVGMHLFAGAVMVTLGAFMLGHLS